jgi:hypothetical protein
MRLESEVSGCLVLEAQHHHDETVEHGVKPDRVSSVEHDELLRSWRDERQSLLLSRNR